MKHASFQKFIDLVTFDKKYHDLKEQLETAQKSIDACKVNRTNFENAVEASIARKDEAHKAVKESELEIQTLDEREKKQKEILDQVTSVKEEKAAQKELEAVQFKRNEIEQNLSQLWNRYESLEEESKAAQIEGQEEVQKINEEIAKYDAVISDIDKALKTYNDERSQRLEGIKGEWLEKYDMMRGRSVNPVVPITQESCSVCFYMVSSQDLQKLKQGDLLHCKDCYRLLYYSEETLQDQSAE